MRILARAFCLSLTILIATHPTCLAQKAASLPIPTGDFVVGTSIVHVVDSTRSDFISNSPTAFRELMVQVWYPADGTETTLRAPYVADPAILQHMEDRGFLELPATLIASWGELMTHALFDVPIASTNDALPVLLFSHGLGIPRFHYTSLIQELASHGYIVVAIDHPYGGLTQLTNGRILSSSEDRSDLNDPSVIAARTSAWAADASLVLDQLLDQHGLLGRFAPLIDQTKIGMFGHSLGGAAALEACIDDKRIKACVNLDGAPFGKIETEGLGAPALIMGSGPVYSDADLEALGRTREQWERMGEQYLSIVTSVLTQNTDHPAYQLSVRGAGHMSYSDASFVMPDTITRFGGEIINARRGHEIITACIRAFFDQYLERNSTGSFEQTVARYSEVSLRQFNQDE